MAKKNYEVKFDVSKFPAGTRFYTLFSGQREVFPEEGFVKVRQNRLVCSCGENIDVNPKESVLGIVCANCGKTVTEDNHIVTWGGRYTACYGDKNGVHLIPMCFSHACCDEKTIDGKTIVTIIAEETHEGIEDHVWEIFPCGVNLPVKALVDICKDAPTRVKPEVAELLKKADEEGISRLPYSLNTQNYRLYFDVFKNTGDANLAASVIGDVKPGPVYYGYPRIQYVLKHEVKTWDEYKELFPHYLHVNQKTIECCGVSARRWRGDLATLNEKNEAGILLATEYFNQGLFNGKDYLSLVTEYQDALENPGFCRFFKAWFPQCVGYFGYLITSGKDLKTEEFNIRRQSIDANVNRFVSQGYEYGKIREAMTADSYLEMLNNISKIRRKKGETSKS